MIDPSTLKQPVRSLGDLTERNDYGKQVRYVSDAGAELEGELIAWDKHRLWLYMSEAEREAWKSATRFVSVNAAKCDFVDGRPIAGVTEGD